MKLSPGSLKALEYLVQLTYAHATLNQLLEMADLVCDAEDVAEICNIEREQAQRLLFDWSITYPVPATRPHLYVWASDLPRIIDHTSEYAQLLANCPLILWRNANGYSRARACAVLRITGYWLMHLENGSAQSKIPASVWAKLNHGISRRLTAELRKWFTKIRNIRRRTIIIADHLSGIDHGRKRTKSRLTRANRRPHVVVRKIRQYQQRVYLANLAKKRKKATNSTS